MRDGQGSGGRLAALKVATGLGDNDNVCIHAAMYVEASRLERAEPHESHTLPTRRIGARQMVSVVIEPIVSVLHGCGVIVRRHAGKADVSEVRRRIIVNVVSCGGMRSVRPA